MSSIPPPQPVPRSVYRRAANARLMASRGKMCVIEIHEKEVRRCIGLLRENGHIKKCYELLCDLSACLRHMNMQRAFNELAESGERLKSDYGIDEL